MYSSIISTLVFIHLKFDWLIISFILHLVYFFLLTICFFSSWISFVTDLYLGQKFCYWKFVFCLFFIFLGLSVIFFHFHIFFCFQIVFFFSFRSFFQFQTFGTNGMGGRSWPQVTRSRNPERIKIILAKQKPTSSHICFSFEFFSCQFDLFKHKASASKVYSITVGSVNTSRPVSKSRSEPRW